MMTIFFQKLSASRNIARNNLDGTERSSGLRGTDVNVDLSFDMFSFCFFFTCIYNMDRCLQELQIGICHSDCGYPGHEDCMIWLEESWIKALF